MLERLPYRLLIPGLGLVLLTVSLSPGRARETSDPEPASSVVLLVRTRSPEGADPPPVPLGSWTDLARDAVLVPRLELPRPTTTETETGVTSRIPSLETIIDPELREILKRQALPILDLSTGPARNGQALARLEEHFGPSPPPTTVEVEFRSRILDLLGLESDQAGPETLLPRDRQVIRGLQGGYRMILVEENDPESTGEDDWALRLARHETVRNGSLVVALLEIIESSPDPRVALLVTGTGIRRGWILRESLNLTELGATLVHLIEPGILPEARRTDIFTALLED